MISGCCDEPEERPEEEPEMDGIPSGLNWLAQSIKANLQLSDSEQGPNE